MLPTNPLLGTLSASPGAECQLLGISVRILQNLLCQWLVVKEIFCILTWRAALAFAFPAEVCSSMLSVQKSTETPMTHLSHTTIAIKNPTTELLFFTSFTDEILV